jgi:hypothetical protein
LRRDATDFRSTRVVGSSIQAHAIPAERRASTPDAIRRAVMVAIAGCE